MKFDLKPFPWITLAIGFIIYLFCIINNSFINSTLALMITLSIWTCLHIAMDSFDINHLAQLLSVSGYIFAATIFFYFGIEQVSYPAGAIIFHAEGIAQALAVALLSSMPLLKLYHKAPVENKKEEDRFEDENWERAREDDLSSNQYELDS